MLVIEGSGLQGPIPSEIADLERLSVLRLSDLDGPESPVPKLGCRNIVKLILRSCNLMGELPAYLAKMTNLKTLDLSFNNLSGKIPESYRSLENIGYLYLTGNQLTGAVPDWILVKGKNV
ncbi:probable LRR receptor-like serine/threonine-protein kinase At1g53420 [Eucalyptus grandis]|uniref:probable LRR receptor-like serine/threonine-protein kinase At1g53420 n=1 Tax=Eucalyptus grandis TaxID=71139 RepID=UPI00192E7D40|nr:probable LRR receptor-like serine/threonine-protein kinase At1g53420 [Eucalyptus grandis]